MLVASRFLISRAEEQRVSSLIFAEPSPLPKPGCNQWVVVREDGGDAGKPLMALGRLLLGQGVCIVEPLAVSVLTVLVQN